jgi:hypothetical protein
MTATNGIFDERYRAEVWTLANEWVQKIEKAYDDYNAQRGMLQRNLYMYLISIMVVAAAGPLFSELSRDLTPSFSFPGGKLILVFPIFVLTLVAMFDLFRRVQTLKLVRNELGDLWHISQELFQMIISSEEKHTENKYEYLVNHVRILEIRHLLRKVERVTRGRSIIFD